MGHQIHRCPVETSLGNLGVFAVQPLPAFIPTESQPCAILDLVAILAIFIP